MALRTLIVLAFVVIAVGNELQEADKAQKAMAAEKEKSRSANPGRERGSFKKLSTLMNITDDRKQYRRRGKEPIKKILQISRDRIHDDNNMMNDNEGALTTNLKTTDQNNTLQDKLDTIRHGVSHFPGTINEVKNIDYVSQAAGVFCNFENETTINHMCMWQWNMSVSSHGLGFKVATAGDVARMNGSTRGLRFSGPATDADASVGGELIGRFRLFSMIVVQCRE